VVRRARAAVQARKQRNTRELRISTGMARGKKGKGLQLERRAKKNQKERIKRRIRGVQRGGLPGKGRETVTGRRKEGEGTTRLRRTRKKKKTTEDSKPNGEATSVKPLILGKRKGSF